MISQLFLILPEQLLGMFVSIIEQYKEEPIEPTKIPISTKVGENMLQLEGNHDVMRLR